ncbi:hypothetical protein COK19_14375 [Bacillus cereus]|uniref:hypothetical protein n=1 Tax=Bacillus cereus TaxID=1396 RepID=UPI000BF9AE08|nr:hypothetical protein [Bacillus cereus]PFR25757.1 hypothetical protein COK19_14375 [Bacillus cereus]
MLKISQTMQFIRCSRYEYLVKKGSISNYSFNLKDEEQSGILEIIFEEITFPISRDDLEAQLLMRIEDIDSNHITSLLDQLLEVEILYEVSTVAKKNIKICVIADNERIDMIMKAFEEQSYEMQPFVIKNPPSESNNIKYINLQNENDAFEQLEEFEYVLVFKEHFSPSTFYQVNKLCLELNKKLIISYLDGNEGVIIPLVNFSQIGCYNDFEILRESSFYNLLDYQIMKEQLLQQDYPHKSSNNLHFNILVNQTVLLLNHYSSYTNINYYAYSLDFERMINTKSRLLKFPKCPSCQSDKNLVHAFI